MPLALADSVATVIPAATSRRRTSLPSASTMQVSRLYRPEPVVITDHASLCPAVDGVDQVLAHKNAVACVPSSQFRRKEDASDIGQTGYQVSREASTVLM